MDSPEPICASVVERLMILPERWSAICRPTASCSKKISFGPALDALVECFFGETQEIALVRDPRTVEQYVDAAELGNRPPHGFFDFRFLGHVELKCQRAPPDRANLGRQLFRFIRFVIDHDAVCAFAGESHGDRFGAGFCALVIKTILSGSRIRCLGLIKLTTLLLQKRSTGVKKAWRSSCNASLTMLEKKR